jgi:hypothetical protein
MTKNPINIEFSGIVTIYHMDFPAETAKVR